MGKVEKAIQQMEAWANDDSHGYDQTYRWGQKGDYDCSAAVIQSWENAGVPVKTNGATYTGNMLSSFLAMSQVQSLRGRPAGARPSGFHIKNQENLSANIHGIHRASSCRTLDLPSVV